MISTETRDALTAKLTTIGCKVTHTYFQEEKLLVDFGYKGQLFKVDAESTRGRDDSAMDRLYDLAQECTEAGLPEDIEEAFLEVCLIPVRVTIKAK